VIVVDASALVELILRTPTGAAIEQRIVSSAETLHAPHLIDIETTHVLRRYVAKGIIDAKRGREAIDDVASLSLRRYGHVGLLPRVWEMRDNLTAYDAVYVALAEVLNATLLTCDRRLAAAAGHRVRIEAM
jgi:predicted nucleic acid-binding protein